jgi:hypothetical protein
MNRHPKLRGHSMRPAQSYSPKEISTALDVAETTVRSWIREGKLPAMTNGNPHLVLGSDLVVFLAKKRNKKPPLADDQFRCMRCRTARKALGGMADFKATSSHLGHLSALCEVCGTTMCKGAGLNNLKRLQTVFDLRFTDATGNYPIPGDAS